MFKRSDHAESQTSVKGYHSIKLPLYAGVVVIYTISFIFLGTFFFQMWRSYWTSQRLSEAYRYANFLASEISYNEGEDTLISSSVSSELQDFSRMYRYMRVLVLDEDGKVVLDTSQSRVGRYIINDEVLKALSGDSSQEGDEEVTRIAVPVTSEGGETVRGVVYAFVNMERVLQSLADGRQRIVLIIFLVALISALLCYLLVYECGKPLTTLLNWVKGIRRGQNAQTLNKPEFHGNTEYNALTGAIEELTAELLTVDQSRKEFVSNVSHELKTPLSSIKVLTESLLLQHDVPEETYRDFLSDINQEIDRMNGIVSDLLTLVRLEEGGEKVLNLTTFELSDLIDENLKHLQPLAEQHHITLSKEVVHPVTLEADETKLGLAIANLIQNGIKYNKDGGTVNVRIDCNSVYALIVVSDTGIGIDESEYSKLFNRFYRVDKSRNRDSGPGGTGLGLSIVRQIVNLHKGSITVSSVVGEGSSFSIKMPLVQTADTEEEE